MESLPEREVHLKLLAAIQLLFIFSTGVALGADTPPLFLELACSGSATPSQPCGGFNTRTIHLMFSDLDKDVASGYREEVSYGGCYPISEHNFGTIANVRRDGDEVSFDFVFSGSIWQGNVPVVWSTAPQVKPMPAQLNLKTSILKIDTRDVFWPYREPAVLDCKPVQ